MGTDLCRKMVLTSWNVTGGGGAGGRLHVHNLKINYGYKSYNPIEYNAVNKTNVSKNVTVWENAHSIVLKMKKRTRLKFIYMYINAERTLIPVIVDY